MKTAKWFKMAALTCVLCGAVAGATAAAAGDAIKLRINGEDAVLPAQPQLVDGNVIAPVRAVAEALGATVTWDGDAQTVHLEQAQRAPEREAIVNIIKEQGKEKADNYYFPGLSYQPVQLDDDPESELFARIDGAVHLGQFFVLDRQPDGKYRLTEEQAWKVESWSGQPIVVQGKKLFEIVTRDGGTGADLYEARLGYFERGQWVEAWKGTLKDMTSTAESYRLAMGSYRVNEDDGRLYYWRTAYTMNAEASEQTAPARTEVAEFAFDGKSFRAAEETK